MTRHFFQLYLLVVLAIAAVSWTQERLWLTYSNQVHGVDGASVSLLRILEHELRSVPTDQRDARLASLAAGANVALELLTRSDIAGDATLTKLANGEIAFMQAESDESWLLKQLDAQTVLALQYHEPRQSRGLLEWSLALLLYAVIALAVMLWIWPLTRDLRRLELATASFGNRNWLFRADISRRSQVYSLAETFRKMAARIDGLIASHKDLSNAISHEIKTPLARMQFEIEAARRSSDDVLQKHLRNIKDDIAVLNALVTATLDYAVLERADMALNIGRHDFTRILPAIVEQIERDSHGRIALSCKVAVTATQTLCDAHLMEAVLKNLVYNATRFARSRVEVSFEIGETYLLRIDDDGPGIPEQDRQRVFGSFVQLANAEERKTGFGLGLAIVKRAVEWHNGEVSVSTAALGGASFVVTWPKPP